MNRTLFVLALGLASMAPSLQAQEVCTACSAADVSDPAPPQEISVDPQVQEAPPVDDRDWQDTQDWQNTQDTHEALPPPESYGNPPVETIEVRSGMLPPVAYGPPPPFRDLDTNRNGVISEREAEAYIPLANDFLHASRGKPVVTRHAYQVWAAEPQ